MGEIIKQERERLGVTQKELAKLVGVTPSSIGMYEQGRRNPDKEIMIKLCKVFGISIDYLLGNIETRNTIDEITTLFEEENEVIALWNTIKDREDLKELLDKLVVMDEKAIYQVSKIIEVVKE